MKHICTSKKIQNLVDQLPSHVINEVADATIIAEGELGKLNTWDAHADGVRQGIELAILLHRRIQENPWSRIFVAEQSVVRKWFMYDRFYFVGSEKDIVAKLKALL